MPFVYVISIFTPLTTFHHRHGNWNLSMCTIYLYAMHMNHKARQPLSSLHNCRLGVRKTEKSPSICRINWGMNATFTGFQCCISSQSVNHRVHVIRSIFTLLHSTWYGTLDLNQSSVRVSVNNCSKDAVVYSEHKLFIKTDKISRFSFSRHLCHFTSLSISLWNVHQSREHHELYRLCVQCRDHMGG